MTEGAVAAETVVEVADGIATDDGPMTADGAMTDGAMADGAVTDDGGAGKAAL